MDSAVLFVPADRPERIAKAVDRADAVIVDLEDAVAPADRPTARLALAALAGTLDPARTLVRVNAATTSDCAPDVAAALAAGVTICVLAKAESRADVEAAAPLQVVALIETPRGVLTAPEIARAPNCVGLMWGSEDLAAALGASHSRPGGVLTGVLEAARHAVLLAARAHGRVAIDSPFTDIADEAGLHDEARAAHDLGFDAKACIHPAQVAVIRDAFAPADADVAWAHRVVDERARLGSAVFQLDGAMIDAPVIQRAEAILRRLPRP